MSKKILYVGSGANLPADLCVYQSIEQALSECEGEVCIVICSPVSVSGELHTKCTSVRFTSREGWRDFRDSGAQIILSGDVCFRFTCSFDNISIRADESACILAGADMHISDGVQTTGDISLGIAALDGQEHSILIKVCSGKWKNALLSPVCASRRFADSIALTLDGGEIYGSVHMLGSCIYTERAQISLTVKSGFIGRGIFGTALSDAKESKACVLLDIKGGRLRGNIRPCLDEHGSLSGEWNVRVCGGSFASVSELSGQEESGALLSRISFDGYDPSIGEECYIEHKNPICRGADPWVTVFRGYYYYTATMSGKLRVFKAPNIADLPHTQPKVVYTPDTDTDFKGLWSPELHYFSAEDFGVEHEGWYLYLAGNRKNAEGNALPVMFVMRSLTGEPDGQYGHPVTGEPNRFISIDSCADIDYTRIWAVGQTVIKIDGKIYSMYVSEEGRGTPDFVQHINIAEMKNPYSFSYPHKIVSPTEYYESHGHSYSREQNKWWPRVVEGGTALYGDNGEVYITYSSSGYWTTYYCLSQLRYTEGDPLESSSYVKDKKPFLVREDTLHERSVNGCGHASFVRDLDGGRWICYHAYIGKDTKSKRFFFLEPYSIDGDGNICVGNGSGHPSPLDTVFRIKANPMPLAQRIHGFDKKSK